MIVFFLCVCVFFHLVECIVYFIFILGSSGCDCFFFFFLSGAINIPSLHLTSSKAAQLEQLVLSSQGSGITAALWCPQHCSHPGAQDWNHYRTMMEHTGAVEEPHACGQHLDGAQNVCSCSFHLQLVFYFHLMCR